ncbi:hypothetical protein KFL_008390040 [Klebsormidium nitens]|uniref:FLZ-type domain-containing protein n=1 Tax=Klebsormidium nitens TaxID=105231 RepID=A0A1Y1IR62_KLENI|nr:hypothetical protein KFL_008390040 [Klebsormidium nitens]|eukprot:GAQ91721.1 hypothetical protein KFL_008390040 [Klebsormidium nitens]
MNCLRLFRRPSKTRYEPAATSMANPTSVKLGKRARSSLQRTVSRDSLSDLNKLNALDVLAPIDDGGPTEADAEPPQEARGFLGAAEWAEPVKASLESLTLDDPVELNQGPKPAQREVLRELGQGGDNSDKGRLLADVTMSPTKPKRKWWAMGGRAQSAAATKLPFLPTKPVKCPVYKPDAEPLNQEPLVCEVSKAPIQSAVVSPPPDMEIVHNDTSPKWTSSQNETDSPRHSLSAESPKQLDRDDQQRAEAQAQKYGARGAAFVRKEQVSERLHHAAHRSPKKGGAGGRLTSPTKLMSPTLSPIVYCRQDSGQEVAELLNACGGCRRGLDSKKDIYMYGGEKAFCSVSCRSKAIAREEMAHVCSAKARQGPAPSMLPRLW